MYVYIFSGVCWHLNIPFLPRIAFLARSCRRHIDLMLIVCFCSLMIQNFGQGGESRSAYHHKLLTKSVGISTARVVNISSIVKLWFDPPDWIISVVLCVRFQAEAAHHKRRAQVGSALRISLTCRDALVSLIKFLSKCICEEILDDDVIFISETQAPDRRAEKRRLAEAVGVSIDRLQLFLDIWTISVTCTEELFVVAMGDSVKHGSAEGGATRTAVSGTLGSNNFYWPNTL